MIETSVVSRRSFLGGALALTAAASLPASRLFASVPLIWGDGVHDDWAGMQAALNGEPFKALGERVITRNAGGKVLVRSGLFRLSRTLTVPEAGIISGGSFHADDLLEGPVIDLRGGMIKDFHIQCGRRTSYGVSVSGGRSSRLENGVVVCGTAISTLPHYTAITAGTRSAKTT